MVAFYNEIDPFAAQWLRELIKAGHIPSGDVDERSIEDIHPADLKGYTQCHFFAGIGGWPYALRLAGVSDNTPVWTGSCPCQPFSSAGKGAGFADERHLWPSWFHLIEQCRPPLLFGEQVASKPGLSWIELVHADLEGADYAVWTADLCAASVSAPHIRQRLFFVGKGLDDTAGTRHSRPISFSEAEARHKAWVRLPSEGGGTCGMVHGEQPGLEGYAGDGNGSQKPGRVNEVQDGSASEAGGVSRMADASRERRKGRRILVQPGGQDQACDEASGPSPASGLANSECDGQYRSGEAGPGGRSQPSDASRGGWADAAHSFWGSPDWLFCRDGKWRPAQSGIFPLAPRIPGRVALLRGYGNSIVPPLAAAFIEASLEDGQ